MHLWGKGLCVPYERIPIIKHASSQLAAMSFVYAGVSLAQESPWAVWVTAIVVGELCQKWHANVVHKINSEEERRYKDVSEK